MDLSDALSDWPADSSQSGSQQHNASWPGQPGQPGQPSNPTWPGQPTWPGAQPAPNPTWPGPAQGGGPWSGQPTWPNQPSAPGGWPSPSPGPAPVVPAAAQQSLMVPYKLNLPSGVYNKLLIVIAGTIKPNADKITLDLNTAKDLAFHFNPRFNESGKRVIVRNSCVGQKWGREERELQNFPFVPGQPFEMKILCTNTEFKVAVNNSHLLEFKHRITDLGSIRELSIYYDLTLSKVQLENLS